MTEHPTIPGVVIKEYEEDGMPARECAHSDFSVFVERSQEALVFLSLDQGNVVSWVTVEEARTLAAMIRDQAAWLAEQGATK